MMTHGMITGLGSSRWAMTRVDWRRVRRVGRAVVLVLVSVFVIWAPAGFAREDSKDSTAKAEAKAEPQGDSANASGSEDTTEKININEASGAELEALPGIGPTLAARIIEGRPYEKIQDITRVKGIGPKTFEKIKDRITVK